MRLSATPRLGQTARVKRCGSRVVAERLVEVIGCAGDAHEFAVVEPVEIAEVAGVEHHIAWACVEVGLHGAAAVRAGNVAAEIVWVGCSADGDAGVLLNAQILDELREKVHGDEPAAAFAAEEDGRFGDRTLGERDMAERALVSGAVAEKGNAFIVLFGHYDGAAVVALEGIAGDAHLSAEPKHKKSTPIPVKQNVGRQGVPCETTRATGGIIHCRGASPRCGKRAGNRRGKTGYEYRGFDVSRLAESPRQPRRSAVDFRLPDTGMWSPKGLAGSRSQRINSKRLR